MAAKNSYPASFEIDYPDELDRVSTFFRLVWAIPILVILALLSGGGNETFMDEANKEISSSGTGIISGLAAATALMIVFRQRYPKWWFDFVLELNRFTARVGAYIFLLTDKYPSTVEKQAVHLDVKYPDVKKELSWWMPLVKWLLALPHYLILVVLVTGVVIAVVIAWFSILFTGRYPRSLFDYVVGVGRWNLRVNAYAFILATDEYPPFSLN